MNPIKDPVIKYTKLFINNEFVDAIKGKTFPAVNPANFEELAQVQEAQAEDVDKAVEAAKAAFDRSSDWRKLDASARGELLYKLAELMERDIEYLATLETLNCGKPFSMSIDDVKECCETLKDYAFACEKANGDAVLPTEGRYNSVHNKLLGVCGAITPSNHPIRHATSNLGHCCAIGNMLVFKPAEQSPLTALALAALVKEAGFPPGVFNVLPGFGPTAGQPLVQHPDVRRISFLGSTQVGKLIQRDANPKPKHVSVEMLGKCALIILGDADLDKAVECAFNNPNARTFVHESIYDEFVTKTVALARRRTVGNELKGVDQGPQMDEIEFKRILSLIESAKRQGAKLECGGKRMGEKGWFIEPTVFSNVTDDMSIAKAELFCPVELIMRFKDIDEVIERVIFTAYGYGGGVFSQNMDNVLDVKSRLETGKVYIDSRDVDSPNPPIGFQEGSGLDDWGKDSVSINHFIKSSTAMVEFVCD